MYLRFNRRHIYFRSNATSHNIHNSTVEQLDLENMGISFLSDVYRLIELELCRVTENGKLLNIFLFLAAILDIWLHMYPARKKNNMAATKPEGIISPYTRESKNQFEWVNTHFRGRADQRHF